MSRADFFRDSRFRHHGWGVRDETRVVRQYDRREIRAVSGSEPTDGRIGDVTVLDAPRGDADREQNEEGETSDPLTEEQIGGQAALPFTGYYQPPTLSATPLVWVVCRLPAAAGSTMIA